MNLIIIYEEKEEGYDYYNKKWEKVDRENLESKIKALQTDPDIRNIEYGFLFSPTLEKRDN